MSAIPKSTIQLDIKKLTPHIGAEISNIDLSAHLPDDVIEAIRQALLDHKVVFFRDQDLTTEEHIEFTKRFGELEVHPFAPHKEGYPPVLAIDHGKKNTGQENMWHSDVTWRLEPSLGSILRAITLPEVGGDTLFANMEMAYDKLSDELKQQLDGLTAVHDAVYFRNRMKKGGMSQEKIDEIMAQYPIAEHPVIRTHPDTGRKSIYVNSAFTKHIVGMEKAASDELLSYLYSRASIPEYQCRFNWQPNSIAFWDNRSCQHYAASDYWPERRSMERVTIIGDTPK